MGVLANLEPASVFHYFEEICSIPHTSHHEKALSDYCVQFAKAHGLACRQDEMGNVLIKAPATLGYENQPALILQGHLDMVGDKTAACPLDREMDAIQLVVDGDYVRAEGTELRREKRRMASLSSSSATPRFSEVSTRPGTSMLMACTPHGIRSRALRSR